MNNDHRAGRHQFCNPVGDVQRACNVGGPAALIRVLGIDNTCSREVPWQSAWAYSRSLLPRRPSVRAVRTFSIKPHSIARTRATTQYRLSGFQTPTVKNIAWCTSLRLRRLQDPTRLRSHDRWLMLPGSISNYCNSIPHAVLQLTVREATHGTPMMAYSQRAPHHLVEADHSASAGWLCNWTL